MAVGNAAQAIVKDVGDPVAEYESIRSTWERATKDYDNYIDSNTFSNLLIPFSATMSARQYNFYKAEAELPGITSQFSRMIIGGLLRKPPILQLPDSRLPLRLIPY